MKKSGQRAEPVEASAPDLELPDWSGMVDSSRHVSPELALRLLDDYWQLWVKLGHAQTHERPPKCEVEFKL